MTQTNPAKDIAKGAGVIVGGPLVFIGTMMISMGAGLGSLGLIPPAFSLVMGKTDGIGRYFQSTARVGVGLWSLAGVGVVTYAVGAAAAGAAVKKDS